MVYLVTHGILRSDKIIVGFEDLYFDVVQIVTPHSKSLWICIVLNNNLTV